MESRPTPTEEAPCSESSKGQKKKAEGDPSPRAGRELSFLNGEVDMLSRPFLHRFLLLLCNFSVEVCWEDVAAAFSAGARLCACMPMEAISYNRSGALERGTLDIHSLLNRSAVDVSIPISEDECAGNT